MIEIGVTNFKESMKYQEPRMGYKVFCVQENTKIEWVRELHT